jgi:pantetheine-phosphate adenylyltransferase
MSGTRAVYAGTFDAFTKGHLWMVERGVALFGELIVAIGLNPDKKTLFTLEERLEMLREVLGPFPTVRIDSFPLMFLVDYAASVDAQFILRGIRNEADLGFEMMMRHLNEDINPGIQTVFLTPPRGLIEVSSSVVRGLVGPQGWEPHVARYVPEPVFLKLKEKHDARTRSLE